MKRVFKMLGLNFHKEDLCFSPASKLYFDEENADVGISLSLMRDVPNAHRLGDTRIYLISVRTNPKSDPTRPHIAFVVAPQ